MNAKTTVESAVEMKEFPPCEIPWSLDLLRDVKKAYDRCIAHGADKTHLKAIRKKFFLPFNATIIKRVEGYDPERFLTSKIYRGENTTILDHLTNEVYACYVEKRHKTATVLLKEIQLQRLSTSQSEIVSIHVPSLNLMFTDFIRVVAWRIDTGMYVSFFLEASE